MGKGRVAGASGVLGRLAECPCERAMVSSSTSPASVSIIMVSVSSSGCMVTSGSFLFPVKGSAGSEQVGTEAGGAADACQ